MNQSHGGDRLPEKLGPHVGHPHPQQSSRTYPSSSVGKSGSLVTISYLRILLLIGPPSLSTFGRL